jgi:hypothetical protein
MRARVLGVVVLVVAAMPCATAAAKCPSSGARSAPVVSESPPPADLAARLGVLRRDQTAEDRATIEAFKHQGLRILYGTSLRLLRSEPDGRTWYLYAGKTAALHFERSCLRRMPASLRRTLLLNERRSIVQARKVQFGVFEFAGSGSGGFFGGNLRSLTHNLTTLSVARSGGASLSALVPDGVAWIDMTLAGGETRVVGVTDNFWQIDVGSTGFQSLPTRTVWKAADGTVVGTFRGR